MASSQTIEFISPLGATIDFTDKVHYRVPRGKFGFTGIPTELLERETPFVAGSTLLAVQTKPRIIEFPVLLTGNSRNDFLDRMAYLARHLDPNLGDGVIRYTRPNGQARQITCRANGVFSDSTDTDFYGPSGNLLVLRFKAFEPFWYPTTPTEASYGVSAAGAFFPIFPLEVAPDGLSGGATLNNPGDAPAWPIWTITGPGSDFALINNTTGYRLDMSTTSITAGQTLVIDTRPGYKTAEVGGVSVFDEVDSTSTFWPLVVGNNVVELQLTGATGETLVEVAFYPPYNSV